MAAEHETLVMKPAPAALDRAAGVELLGPLDGAGYEAGVALVRRADGQVVQLGPLMYALLECIDGQRSTEELADAMCDRLGRACDADAVEALARKLAAQGLLAGSEGNAPPRQSPLLALRWKVLVTNPRITRKLTAPFAVLFHPLLLVPVVAAFAVCVWFLLIHKGLGSATADAFQNPGLLLLVFALGVASAGFHELGHAAACRYGGATPGGMGAGLYLVWPAFWTDVTDAYRLPRGGRLRVDLGGIYFNTLVTVATTGAWLVWRADALLLLAFLQLLMIVKNLSPIIRSDGYHVLADATGVPDLYAHIGPTLRRLVPGRREPSALKGRARLLVTLWVVIVAPLLASLLVGALLLLPTLATTAWVSGRAIIEALPEQSVTGVLSSLVRLLALILPLLGTILLAQRLVRGAARKAHAWSEGRPVRRAAVLGLATATAAAAALAWWPAGQYRPVGNASAGTLTSFTHLLASPASVARPAPPPPRLEAGRHLAIALVPRGGPSRAHPTLLVVPTTRGQALAIALTADGSQTVRANSFPFTLPSAPRPGDTQALAVNRTDDGVVYDVAYAVVKVEDGAPVTNANSAFAFANCKACTTVAVSFQVVLVIGQSNTIAPINAAGALNVDCPSCMTLALATQLVITLKAEPSEELMQKIQASLDKLGAIPGLGSAKAILGLVQEVQKEIQQEIDESGLAPTQPKQATTTPTPTTATTPAETTTTTEAATTTAPTTTTAPPTTTAPATTTAPTTTQQTTTEPTTTTESTTTSESTTTTTTSG